MKLKNVNGGYLDFHIRWATRNELGSLRLQGGPSVVSLSTEGRETFDSATQLQHDDDFRIKHGLNNEKEIKVHLHNNNLMQRSSTSIAEHS